MGKISLANLKKTVYYLKRNGLKSTLNAVRERVSGAGQPEYQPETLSDEERKRQRSRAESGLSGLVFSVVVPIYHTPETYFREMVESVLNQTYPRWELILADASENDSMKQIADSWGDNRIRYVRLAQNAGIAENTNQGAALATGDYVGLLDHDDVLAENALYEMAERIEQERKKGVELALLYSDEDKCNGDRTEYYEPNFKEKFNLDLLLSNNYICHFTVMKRELMQRLKLRTEYDGAQDYDLVLRAAFELTGNEERIAHIPRVLYHWRCHTSSTAENPQSKLYAYEAGRRAVQDFADRKGWAATAVDTEHLGFYRLEYHGDIFEIRPEIGAIGGPVICKGKIAGGRMSGEGDVFYQELPASYSGYLHRAALQQEAEALDIRNLCVRKELQGLAERIRLEYSGDSKKCSLALGKAIREAGYKLLFLPERAEKQ